MQYDFYYSAKQKEFSVKMYQLNELSTFINGMEYTECFESGEYTPT